MNQALQAIQRDSASGTRHGEILRELHRNGKVLVDDLAARFKISSSTIRRDLAELERSGFLRRTHGGAVPIEQFLYEPFRHVSSFQEQEQQRALEKRLIGLAAAELVLEGETVAIGAGTTTTQVARNLRHRKGIMIVTNAVNIAMELSHSRDVKVCLTGGFLSGDWFALVGPTAIASVGEIFVDKAFIGVDGAHPVHGLTTNYPDQAAIHQAMMKQARQKIAVADHSKIGIVGTALICAPAGIDLLITDRKVSEKKIAPFLKKGIRVRMA
jgi:DeoR family transcriptional regulator, aga operon transcriptional repressor